MSAHWPVNSWKACRQGVYEPLHNTFFWPGGTLPPRDSAKIASRWDVDKGRLARNPPGIVLEVGL